MVDIALISDTHGILDDRMYSILQECDEIWHAGDIGDIGVWEQLHGLKKNLRAVYGNIDGKELRLALPEVLVWNVEQMKIAMTHIGGYPGHYPANIRTFLAQEKPDIFVCGHSHILKVIYDKEYNLLHLNPGACGKVGFHRVKTMLRFSIEDQRVKDMSIVELEKR